MLNGRRSIRLKAVWIDEWFERHVRTEWDTGDVIE